MSNWKCRSATIHPPAGVNKTVCIAILVLWEMRLWQTMSASMFWSLFIAKIWMWSLVIIKTGHCLQHSVLNSQYVTSLWLKKTAVFKRTSENWNRISCLDFNLFVQKITWHSANWKPADHVECPYLIILYLLLVLTRN